MTSHIDFVVTVSDVYDEDVTIVLDRFTTYSEAQALIERQTIPGSYAIEKRWVIA